jgi:ADP-ribose pyrophosphatase YjhB (NUDIX family)
MQQGVATVPRDRFAVVVHVLIERPGPAGRELFLLRRARTGFMDGFQVPPGGHQHAGESVTEAARRECLEETGALPESLSPVCVMPYRSGTEQGVNFVFAAGRLAGEPRLAEPRHSDAAGWYPVSNLPAPLAPWLEDVLDLQRRGEWYAERYSD